MTAPAIVLLHHFGGSARSWDPVLARLGDAFDAIAIDLAGFGDAAGAPGPYTVASQADYVAARLPVRRPFILVGHSMGGKIAMALAARRPAGLEALLLLAPSPPTPEPIADDARVELIAGWGEYGAMSRTLATITARPLLEPLRRTTLDDMMRAGKSGWTAWLRHGSREDVSADVSAIRVPVTVLSGTQDMVLPTDLLAREVVARLPHATLTPVLDAGHLLPLEAPGAVAAAIRVAVEIRGPSLQAA